METQEKILQLEKDLAAELLATRAEEIDERKLDFMRRHGLLKNFRLNEAANDQGRAYLQKFKASLTEPAEKKVGYSENELKRKVAEYANIRAVKKGYTWNWDEQTKKACRHLLYYFANDPRCIFDLQKGLCFYGSTGVGKTELLKVFQSFIVNILPDNQKRFKLVSCRQVYDDYARGQEAAIEKYTVGNWCFDDLGSEPPLYKHFGNDINVMEQVLFYRNEERQNGYLNTLITTNLNTIELQTRYKDRVYDRLREMVQFIELKGESKRK